MCVYISSSVSGYNETPAVTITIRYGGVIMANIKSAKKRILVSRKKADRNKAIRSGVRTAVKKVYAAIDAKDKDAAASAVLAATSAIDKAASKGVYHNNYASRKISRLNLAVNKL